MGVVVQFDYNGLVALFPEMAPVGAPLLQVYWGIAQTMHGNDGGGPVNDSTLQANLLNMLTAHLAQLFAPRDASGNPAAAGANSPSIVGHISNASEGCVSVTVEALSAFKTAQAQWLASTKYGALYWAATAQFRQVRYRAPSCRAPALGAWPIRFGG